MEQQRQASTKQLVFVLEGVAQWGNEHYQPTLADRMRTLRAYVENDKYWNVPVSAETPDHD